MAADQNQTPTPRVLISKETAKVGAKVHWMKHGVKAHDYNGVIIAIADGKLVIEWTDRSNGKVSVERNDMSRVFVGHLEGAEKAISKEEFLKENPNSTLSRF